MKMNDKTCLISSMKKIFNVPELDDKSVEVIFTKMLIDTPYKQAKQEITNHIIRNNYKPGFFELSKIDNRKIVEKSVHNIINIIEDKQLNLQIQKYSEAKLCEDVLHILSFHTDEKNTLEDIITIQEKDDMIRKIMYYLLMGDFYYNYNSHEYFNQLAFRIVSKLFERTQNYSFHNRLKQSIIGGLIGVNLKDKGKKQGELKTLRYCLSYAEQLSLEDNVTIFHEYIENYIEKNPYLPIDFFDDYNKEIIHTEKPLKVCWITDDYLETIFQLKFIEEQLKFNSNLTFYIIPRHSNNYTNDVSFSDIISMLQTPVFTKLKEFNLKKRLNVCKLGFDQGMFNGLRLSYEAAEILMKCDKVVISGCRSFETAQDLKKDVFYTGLSSVNKNSRLILGGSSCSKYTAFIKCSKEERAYGRVSPAIYNHEEKLAFTAYDFAKKKERVY